MTDLNELREQAINIIDLAEKMDDIFGPENHKEHLIQVIMAGLEDSFRTGFDEGYYSQPT